MPAASCHMFTIPVAMGIESVASSSISMVRRSPLGEPPSQRAPNPSRSTSRAISGVVSPARLKIPNSPSSIIMSLPRIQTLKPFPLIRENLHRSMSLFDRTTSLLGSDPHRYGPRAWPDGENGNHRRVPDSRLRLARQPDLSTIVKPQSVCAGSRYHQRNVVDASGDAKHGSRNSVRNLWASPPSRRQEEGRSISYF